GSDEGSDSDELESRLEHWFNPYFGAAQFGGRKMGAYGVGFICLSAGPGGEFRGLVRLTGNLLTPPRNATFSSAFFTETFDVAVYRLLRHGKEKTGQSGCFELNKSQKEQGR
ncbi:MAG: hypothetical protein ACO3NE_03225, partial [Alphaproteobacteria bacterium]